MWFLVKNIADPSVKQAHSDNRGFPASVRQLPLSGLPKHSRLTSWWFYTCELRADGVRQGFEMIGFDGRVSILSHVKINSPYRVNRYSVDIKNFEAFIEKTKIGDIETRLIIIDEIGKRECCAEKIATLIRMLFSIATHVIATVARKGGGFMTEVKEKEDVRLYELMLHNREVLMAEILTYAMLVLSE